MKRFIFFIILLNIVIFPVLANEKIIIAISATPNNLNPFFSTDANSQNINRLIHRSLIDFNSHMQFECRACETFSSRMQGLKQVIKFRLRDDLEFSDGTKVEADDVKKSWEYYAKNEKIKSTFMGAFEAIENINVIDKNNLEIIYKNFSLENLSNLALLKIIKIKNTGKETIELNDIIGCGDYTLLNQETLEVAIMPKNNKRPILVFKVVKDETTLALKLINKEVDLAVANISPRKVAWLKNQNNVIKTWELPSGNYIFMGLNHKKDIFKDIRVRRALSLLIPRKEILEYKLKNTAVLANGMFSPAFSEMNTDQEIDEYNPKLAEELLSAAGFGKLGKKLELDWKVSNNKASIEVAEVIQHSFEKLGINVNLSIQEWGTYMSSYKSGKFDVVIGQWIGFTGPDMLFFAYHSSSIPPKGGNRISYNNKEVDKYLEQATVETDANKRTDLYKKANKIINSDYAVINLWHPNIVWIGSPCLKNIELVPTGSFDSLPKVDKYCDK